MSRSERELLTLAQVRSCLETEANAEDGRFLQGFFKTGPGEYGEGDKFLGIRVPALRKIAREARALPLSDVETLLRDPWHEARLLALYLMVERYKRGTRAECEEIVRLYLANTAFINNWDLVDSSARAIIGAHLESRPRALLDQLARSESLWERRIAIVATHHMIGMNEHGDTLRIARLLMRDRHDLIHKAVGWMLREVGKHDLATLRSFLAQHAHELPRTTLRYAIERMAADERAMWMAARPPAGESRMPVSTRHGKSLHNR